MNLSERIKLIIKENNLKQKELASIIGVTESYISALLNKKNINPSQSFAMLIEEKLGYNSEWVLNGEEPKLKQGSKIKGLSDMHQRAIMQIEKMSDEQIKAVLAFINSLEEIEKILNIKHPTREQLSADITKIIGNYEGEVEMSIDELDSMIESHLIKKQLNIPLINENVK